MYEFQNRNLTMLAFLESLVGVGIVVVLMVMIGIISSGSFNFDGAKERAKKEAGSAYISQLLMNGFAKNTALSMSNRHDEIIQLIKSSTNQRSTALLMLYVLDTNNEDVNLEWIKPFLIATLEEDFLVKTGEASRNTIFVSKDVFWKDVWSKFPMFWQILGTVSFVCFAISMVSHKKRLVDLPWRKPWVWGFVIMTTPTNAPFFAISGFRFAREKSRHAQNIKNAIHVEPDKNATQLHIDAENREKYKAMWIKIRGESILDKWHTALQNKEQTLINAKRSLQTLGERVVDAQDILASSTRDLKRFEKNGPPDRIPKHESLYDQEFESLLRIPHISSVEIQESEIIILTEPIIIKVFRHHYDMGDYEIRIVTHVENYNSISVKCIRKSKNSGHLYEGADGNFCFGSQRNPIIDEALRRREFLQVICLVLEGLHHINTGAEYTVRKYYRRVKHA